MDDFEVELDQSDPMDNLLSNLYCSYRKPVQWATVNALLNHEPQITELYGPFAISSAELSVAIARLSKNKAVGVDGLSDNTLHEVVKLTLKKDGIDGLNLITGKINSIFASRSWPKYIGTARFIPLSKTSEEYPSIEQVRTIAILPAISKLLELCIMGRLEPIVYSNANLIDNSQAGFRPGCGTEV